MGRGDAEYVQEAAPMEPEQDWGFVRVFWEVDVHGD
jgi:hypothetical protein